MEEDGVRWDVVRSDLCHALGEVIHNGALSRDLHAAKEIFWEISRLMVAVCLLSEGEQKTSKYHVFASFGGGLEYRFL